jgi:hypothetical protein
MFSKARIKAETKQPPPGEVEFEERRLKCFETKLWV